MSFIESQQCKLHQMCFHCRNDENFRKAMEQQHGGWGKDEWGCPLGIPLGASKNQLPEEAQKYLEEMEKRKKEHEERLKQVRVDLDELEMVVPEQGIDLLNRIRYFIFPQDKKADNCENNGGKIGEVDQECCGGKINKVDAYKCSKHTLTTDRKCNQCPDFKKKKS